MYYEEYMLKETLNEQIAKQTVKAPTINYLKVIFWKGKCIFIVMKGWI